MGRESLVLLGESSHGRSFLLQEGDWKIVQGITAGKQPLARRFGKVKLYNPSADPEEQTNLAAKEPRRVSELQDALRKMLGGRSSR